MDVMSSIIRNSKEEVMDLARQLGEEYERESHMCPQATLAALQDVLHFRDDTLFRSCFGLHGGGGDSNDGTCGALVGGSLAIGYFFGRTRSEFDFRIQNCQATGLVRRLHEYFEDAYDGIRCRDVHRKMFGREFDAWNEEELQTFLDMGGHEVQCPQVVGMAAAWTVGLIWDEMNRESRIARVRIK